MKKLDGGFSIFEIAQVEEILWKFFKISPREYVERKAEIAGGYMVWDILVDDSFSDSKMQEIQQLIKEAIYPWFD